MYIHATAVRVALVLLAAGVCVAEARLLRRVPGRPVVLIRAATAGPAPDGGHGIEPAFARHMTPDDVARGVWALATAEGPLALTVEQRATLGPLLAEGTEARLRLGELRTARRATVAAQLGDHAALVEAIGLDRAARMVR